MKKLKLLVNYLRDNVKADYKNKEIVIKYLYYNTEEIPYENRL